MKWPLIQINSVCTVCVDCVNRTAPVVEYETPFKMIRTSNIKKGFVGTDDVKYVNEDTYRRWTRRSTPQRGDVLLTREAPLGSVGRVTTNETIFLGQRIFHYRTDPSKYDGTFLAYALQSPELQARIRSKGFGATVEHMQVGECRNLLIPNPPLAIQRKIGAILAKYDDLIENSRRQIAVIHEAVDQIYQEWFVRNNFPRDKGQQREADVSSNWRRVPLGELVEFHIGGGWGEEGPDSIHSEPAYVIRGTDIPAVALGDSSKVPFRFHKQSNLKTRRLSDGDIIFEASGGSKGQPVGRTLLISNELLSRFDAPVICASFCKRIVPQKRNLSEFLKLHLQFIRAIGLMDTFAVQSASNITNFRFTEFLGHYRLNRPNDDILDEFNTIIVPMFDQLRILGSRVRTLMKGRDLLLPRLMNGDITV